MKKKFWSADRAELTYDLFMVGIWACLVIVGALHRNLGIILMAAYFLCDYWKIFWKNYDEIVKGKHNDDDDHWLI